MSEPKPCGGCCATSNQERCMGCLHDFGTPDSAWVRHDPKMSDDLSDRLVTVAYRGSSGLTPVRPIIFGNDAEELVTRSQAEELLAAEIRRERDLAAKQLSEVVDRMSDDYLALKADNTALTARIKDLEEKLHAEENLLVKVLSKRDALKARVKELEEAHDHWMQENIRNLKKAQDTKAKLETYHEEYENRKEGYEKTIDSLEERLAAAKKVFEFFTDASFDDALVKYQEFQDRGAKARAVLGGKP